MSNLRTGGQVIADHLAANDVEYVAGIPGHGCLPMVDAFGVSRSRPSCRFATSNRRPTSPTPTSA